MADELMTSKAHVERMLKDYQQNKRIMAASEETIRMFVPVTEDEVLETMNFSRADGCAVQNTNVSQKVATVAQAYRTAAKAWNKEALRAMMLEFQAALSEVAFIDYAIKHLPVRECEIMSLFIFQDATWTDVCRRLHLSNTMVGKYRRQAIERICQTYESLYSSFVIHFNE